MTDLDTVQEKLHHAEDILLKTIHNNITPNSLEKDSSRFKGILFVIGQEKDSSHLKKILNVIWLLIAAGAFISKFANGRLTKKLNLLESEQKKTTLEYVEQISEYLSQGRNIVQNFSGYVSDRQIKAFDELSEGIDLLQKAEAKEVNEINSEEILNLFENSLIYFQSSIRLTFVSGNSASLSGDLGDSSGGDSSGGDSSGGGSFGNSGNSNSPFFFEGSFQGEYDPLEELLVKLLAILKWLKEQVKWLIEQAINNPDIFDEAIKIARNNTVKALLKTVSSVFKSVREDIFSQLKSIENQTTDISEQLSELDALMNLEKKSYELEEDFDKNNDTILKQINVFTEKIDSLKMNDNDDSENFFVAKNKSQRDSYYLKSTNQGDKTVTYFEKINKQGVGIVNGDIKGNAKVAGEINEAEKQNLADAATEIQQLLEQLSKTNPTSTNKEKMAVVGEAVDQIENNPTLKAKVVNALKAGGTEAFKEAIDHPLVNILVASIEGWQNAE